ncbi:MAG TPA: DmsC/YnfH family molybdoenzyme membrane anchor subunit [Patescibacteria group bacterium]|nr:DmsC/YnfH family molybdoenzyme membrane anchor subunit [Patescibacteria group bacterium]
MSIQWPLVFFTLFVGLGCGTFVGSVLLTEWAGKAKQIRTISSMIAIVALGIGGIASTLHLGHPERMFGALAHPTSGIFMESTMIFLLGLTIVVYLLAIRRNASEPVCKSIGTIGIVLGVVLAFVNGDAYVMASIPAWNTWILPVLYVISAALMGCFSTGILIARAENADATALAVIKKAALAILAIQTVLLAAYLGHIAIAPYPDATRSMARILTGNLALLFWGGLVLAGLLAPAALMTRFYMNKARNISALATVQLGLACVLVAGVAFRVLMFSVGSSVRQFF